MKRRNSFNLGMIVFLIFSIQLVGCKKNERQKATVNIEFQTTFSGSDYFFENDFANGDGIKIRLELLQFYISNVRFVNKKGKEILADEILLVKLNLNGSGVASVKIPAGDYTSIKFGIGVPKELNESDPSEFSEVDHPLNVTQNTYWGMNGMYRFVMIDGRYDIEGDGVSDGAFSYHTGYDDSYREVEFVKEFSFDRKKEYFYQISIDVSKLFYVNGSIIDLVNESNYHGSLSDIDLSIRVSNNFASSLSFQ